MSSTQQVEDRAEMSFALPPELFNKGWKLYARKSTAPFIAENTEWDMDTGGFPTQDGAIEKARELTIEEEERLAIVSDGEKEEEAEPLVEGVQSIWTAHIRTDGGTQPRSELNMHVVADYTEAMLGGATFPPIEVFWDGASIWLADGFHRLAANKEANWVNILANVRKGTQRDALMFSLGANSTHGLPRSREDKRRVVMVMLEDLEWSKFSDNVIAQKCGVSQPFVSKLRREGVTQNVLSEQPVREGVDGVARDTANIGKEREEDERQATIADLPGVERVTNETPAGQEQMNAAIADSEVDETQETGESKNWTTQDVVDAITRHGGMLYRMQLEEMGISFNAVHKALEEEAITQPETGKFTLPGYKPQPSGDVKSSASSPAPKAKPSMEEIAGGRLLVVSFTWIPGLKGKVNVSVNTSKDPQKASRKLIDSEKVRGFAEEVHQLIVEQMKGEKSTPPIKKGAKKTPTTKAPSRPAKKASKSKTAPKASSKKKATKGRKR